MSIISRLITKAEAWTGGYRDAPAHVVGLIDDEVVRRGHPDRTVVVRVSADQVAAEDPHPVDRLRTIDHLARTRAARRLFGPDCYWHADGAAPWRGQIVFPDGPPTDKNGRLDHPHALHGVRNAVQKAEWLAAQLAAAAHIEEGGDDEPIPAWGLSIPDQGWGWSTGLAYPRREEAGSLLMYSEENGNMDALVGLLQEFLARFPSTKAIGFTRAYTCSSMRPGEFGGGGVLITANTADYWDAHDELNKRLVALTKKASGKKAKA